MRGAGKEIGSDREIETGGVTATEEGIRGVTTVVAHPNDTRGGGTGQSRPTVIMMTAVDLEGMTATADLRLEGTNDVKAAIILTGNAKTAGKGVWRGTPAAVAAGSLTQTGKSKSGGGAPIPTRTVKDAADETVENPDEGSSLMRETTGGDLIDLLNRGIVRIERVVKTVKIEVLNVDLVREMPSAGEASKEKRDARAAGKEVWNKMAVQTRKVAVPKREDVIVGVVSADTIAMTAVIERTKRGKKLAKKEIERKEAVSRCLQINENRKRKNCARRQRSL